MHFVIILLGILAFFLFLTLGVAKDVEKRKLFYLFLLVDIWLGSIFIYLLISAISD